VKAVKNFFTDVIITASRALNCFINEKYGIKYFNANLNGENCVLDCFVVLINVKISAEHF
jgi:hypothetical protein